jgi:hypothetical protein
MGVWGIPDMVIESHRLALPSIRKLLQPKDISADMSADISAFAETLWPAKTNDRSLCYSGNERLQPKSMDGTSCVAEHLRGPRPSELVKKQAKQDRGNAGAVQREEQ